MKQLFIAALALTIAGALSFNVTAAEKAKPKCTKGDCKNGKGTATFPDGKVFEGHFKNAKAEGTGTVTYPAGKKIKSFTGHFKAGKRDGKGTVVYADGKRFEGMYRNGKRDGKGTIYGPDGKVLKQGTWVNGKFQDKGKGADKKAKK